MKKQQPSGFMHDPQVTKLMSDAATVEKMEKSPDANALMEMLNRDGGLKSAAEAAMKGDLTQLQGMLDRLMKDPEGAQVVERLSKTAPK